MEPQISAHALSLLRGAYYGTLIGSLLFLLLREDAAPRVAFAGTAARWRHVRRNLGMLLIIFVFADFLVGYGLMGTGGIIGAAPDGLLSRFDLGWPALLAAGILLVDLFYYAWHRACHAVPWLWRVHRVHHSDTHLDASTGARAHVLETAISIVLVVKFMLWLGIPLWVELVRTLFVNPWQFLQHANLALPAWLDRPLRPLLLTPELHRVHHSPLRAEHDANYGQIFSIWDRCFGTLRLPPASVQEVGLPGLAGESFQTVAGMCATPFRRA